MTCFLTVITCNCNELCIVTFDFLKKKNLSFFSKEIAKLWSEIGQHLTLFMNSPIQSLWQWSKAALRKPLWLWWCFTHRATMGLKHFQFPIYVISSTECRLRPLAEVYGMLYLKMSDLGLQLRWLNSDWIGLQDFYIFLLNQKLKLTKDTYISNNAKQDITAK